MATFRALRHPNYQLYFIGQVISLTGSWMQTTALTSLTFALTDSSSWVAWVTTAQVLPMVFLSAPGGMLADLLPRRWLIVGTQSAQMLLSLVMAVLVYLGLAGPWELLWLSLLTGVAMALDTPARLAFLVEMVGAEDLPNAVALNSMTFNSARLVGPALAAVLLGPLGEAGCFFFNFLTFGAVLAALVAMQLPPTQPKAEGPERGTGAIAYLVGQPDLMLLLVLVAGVGLTVWPLTSLLPAVTKGLDGGKQEYGWMVSAVGFGALIGALVVASWRVERWLVLAAGILSCAVGLAGLGWTSSLWVAAGCCWLVGLGLILFFATGQTIMQMRSSGENRGLVMGVWLTVQAVVNPVGNLAAGRLADLLGERPILLGQAAGVLLVAVAVGCVWMALPATRPVSRAVPVPPSEAIVPAGESGIRR
jgi:MFS family permease